MFISCSILKNMYSRVGILLTHKTLYVNKTDGHMVACFFGTPSGVCAYRSAIRRSAQARSACLTHRLLDRPTDALAYADALSGSNP